MFYDDYAVGTCPQCGNTINIPVVDWVRKGESDTTHAVYYEAELDKRRIKGCGCDNSETETSAFEIRDYVRET